MTQPQPQTHAHAHWGVKWQKSSGAFAGNSHKRHQVLRKDFLKAVSVCVSVCVCVCLCVYVSVSVCTVLVTATRGDSRRHAATRPHKNAHTDQHITADRLDIYSSMRRKMHPIHKRHLPCVCERVRVRACVCVCVRACV